MSHTGARLARLALAFAAVWLLSAPVPAQARVEGPCTGAFNGVEVDRIDSIRSPLELRADDLLTFSGTDDVGTQSANVEVSLVGFRLQDGVTTYGPVQTTFSAELDLADMTTFGVGLYRITGTTDNCTAEAWLRITGRSPLATLAGLTAAGLALGGLTAQLSAIVTRGRWSHITALVGGIGTGLGGALLGQQFGRLQLSWLTILACIAGASLVGFVIANILRPKVGPGFFERRRIAAAEYRSRVTAENQAIAATVSPETRPVRRPAPSPVAQRPRRTPVSEPVAREVRTEEQASEPASDGSAYWCYVMAPTDVFDLNDHTRVVATLQPGRWYLARREAGGWAHVVTSDGGEGWVARTAIHRQG